MAYYIEQKNVKIFKEIGQSDLFKSKDGYTIDPIQGESEFDSGTRLIRNPQGNIIDECMGLYIEDYRHTDGWSPKLYHFEEITGMQRYQPVKWAPEHFPVGTVVKVDKSLNQSVLTEQPDRDSFTIAKLIKNGIDSYCIETDFVIEEGYFKGDAFCFNIDFVTSVVSRGSGKVVIETHSFSPPNVNFIPCRSLEEFTQPITHGNRYKYHRVYNGFVESQVLFDALRVSQSLNSTEFAERFMNINKALKRLKTMGLLKQIVIQDKVIRLVKFKEALKFLKKNPHWAFETLKETVEAYDARFYDEDEDDSDNY